RPKRVLYLCSCGWISYPIHPMMLGLLIAFWATPVMTLSHLLFSTVMSIYVFIGIHFEERGLLRVLGQDYAEWRGKTPMVLPF
ncbi:MAG TPA: hypothetical protein PLE48_17640, partial [Thiobacillus sp.]|nr:hypothetical protein [Thiobacillus sp.]